MEGNQPVPSRRIQLTPLQRLFIRERIEQARKLTIEWEAVCRLLCLEAGGGDWELAEDGWSMTPKDPPPGAPLRPMALDPGLVKLIEDEKEGQA